MLSEVNEESSNIGRVVTFYSFKGGVGRSMAVANISLLLSALSHNRALGQSNRPKILVVDFDLEAPGLELYLLATSKKPKINDIQSTPGLVDLFKGLQDGKQLDWTSCVTEIRVGEHSIDFLSSGRKTTRSVKRGSDYVSSLQSLSWEKLFSERDFGRYLEGLREEWTKFYDYILIDSRTGASDTGDICTILLPDVLVTLFVMNKQNIEGISRIAHRAREVRQKLPIDRTQLLVVPIAARRESAEYSAYANWEEIALNSVEHFYKDWLPKEVRPAEALRLLSLPYVPNWSFGERLPVIEGTLELQDPSSLSSAYARIARLLHSEFDWMEVKDEEANRGMHLGANTLYQEKELLVAEKNDLSAKAAIAYTKMRRHSLLTAIVTTAAVFISFAGLFLEASTLRFQVEKVIFGNPDSKIFNSSVSFKIRASEAPVFSVSIAPDGSRIVSGGGDGTLRIWDAKTGAALGEPLRGHVSGVTSVAFSPDGIRIVSGGSDGTLRLWDVATGAQQGEPLREHTGRVNSVAFSPDGSNIVSGGSDRDLLLWNVATGELMKRISPNEGGVNSVAFSPDGRNIIIGYASGKLELRGATRSSIDFVREATVTNLSGALNVTFSPDGSRIVSNGADGQLDIYGAVDLNFQKRLVAEGEITALRFGPSGTQLASTTSSGDLQIWNVVTGEEIWKTSGVTYNDVDWVGPTIVVGDGFGQLTILRLAP